MQKKSTFYILRSTYSRREGFTILELIIYLVIFGMIGTLMGAVMNFALKGKLSTGRMSEVQLATERALNQIVDRVHTARGILDASSTLNLKMTVASLDPTVISSSSGAITIKEGAGSAIAITPSSLWVTALNFTLVTNPSPSTSSVQITITAGYNVSGTADVATMYTLRTTAMPL